MEKRKSVFFLRFYFIKQVQISVLTISNSIYVGRIIEHILIDGSLLLVNNFHLTKII